VLALERKKEREKKLGMKGKPTKRSNEDIVNVFALGQILHRLGLFIRPIHSLFPQIPAIRKALSNFSLLSMNSPFFPYRVVKQSVLLTAPRSRSP
jgi:hypothetical protein